MILHVVRHAESLANVSRSSVVDCDLSDLGRGQARAVADELARVGIDRVLASPYRRTLCTAQEIAQRANAPLEVMPLLHEHHPTSFGPEWPLMTRSELVVNFAGVVLPDDFVDQGWHTPPEPDQMAQERMKKVLSMLEERFKGSERVALVTHGSPAGKLVQAFMGGAAAEVVIDNASITTLEITGTRRTVKAVNRTDHLKTAVPVEQPVLL